ncbi:MAG: M17 family peptidase N-terminal domain-containing protein [Polyangiaceae bacterium]
MDIRFIAPELRALDSASAEVCVCSIWSDERPIRGLAGLLDWRLGGRISAQLTSDFARGLRGEVLLLPGKPQVPFEKVLVAGLGPRGSFDERSFRSAVVNIGSALEGLRVRRAVVELPGPASGAIDPEAAIAWALDCVGASPEHDIWWLVVPPADQKRIELRAAEERRRVRTA